MFAAFGIGEEGRGKRGKVGKTLKFSWHLSLCWTPPTPPPGRRAAEKDEALPRRQLRNVPLRPSGKRRVRLKTAGKTTESKGFDLTHAFQESGTVIDGGKIGQSSSLFPSDVRTLTRGGRTSHHVPRMTQSSIDGRTAKV